jgi:hypothetical protein
LCVILLGELSHFGTEWQSEAGGGKTFCLSAFLYGECREPCHGGASHTHVGSPVDPPEDCFRISKAGQSVPPRWQLEASRHHALDCEILVERLPTQRCATDLQPNLGQLRFAGIAQTAEFYCRSDTQASSVLVRAVT